MKAAVILSGCGYLDGAEIRESVLTLLYLDQHNVEVQVFAPDIVQHDALNHLTQKPMAESRNVLVEAARIARSKVKPLSELDAAAFDMLLIPGGFGAAKNLSDLAFKGAEAAVLPDFQRVALAFLDARKPIGAICIAPAVLAAAVKGRYNLTLTIGEDPGAAAAISAFGSHHVNCATESYVYDETHHVASCSAYMRDDSLAAIARGIEQVVTRVVKAAESVKNRQAA